MDDLPELESDADVDALMARLRSKVAAASSPLPQSATPRAPIEDADEGDDIDVELASVIARAMQAIVDTLDDLDAEARSSDAQATTHDRARVTRDRRPRQAPGRKPRPRRKTR